MKLHARLAIKVGLGVPLCFSIVTAFPLTSSKVQAQRPPNSPIPVDPGEKLRARMGATTTDALVQINDQVALATLPDNRAVYSLGETLTARVTIASAKALGKSEPTGAWLRLYRAESASEAAVLLWQSPIPEELRAARNVDVSRPIEGAHDISVELPDQAGLWWLRLYNEPEGGTLLAEKRLETIAYVLLPRALVVDPRECSVGQQVSVRLELPEAKNFGTSNSQGVVVALMKQENPRFVREHIVEYQQIPNEHIAGAHELAYKCPNSAGPYELAVFDRFVDSRYLIARQSLLASAPTTAGVDPTGNSLAISCTEVTALRDAVQKLESVVQRANMEYGDLPDATMYQLPPSSDRLSAQLERPRRSRVAEVIKHQGPDDFLLRQRDDASLVGGFRKRALGVVDGQTNCDRERWRETLRDLRRSSSEFKLELRRAEVLFESVIGEVAYHRRRLAPVFSPLLIESAPLAALFGHENAEAVTAVHVSYDFGLWGILNFALWIKVLKEPIHMGIVHHAIGALATIDNLITTNLAVVDALRLLDADKSLKPFLEALEQSAYLEPLVTNYRAISDAMDEVIVEVSRMNKGAP